MPLRALQALHRSDRKSPLPHAPWRGGALRLRFLGDGDARRRTRLAELHAGRAVLAVVGVVHCPLAEDLGAAAAEFARACRAFPDALARRCVAFEPGDAHTAAFAAAAAADGAGGAGGAAAGGAGGGGAGGGAAALREMVLMPAGASAAERDARVRAFVRDLAAALLAGAEDWLLSATVAGVKLNTHLDSGARACVHCTGTALRAVPHHAPHSSALTAACNPSP